MCPRPFNGICPTLCPFAAETRGRDVKVDFTAFSWHPRRRAKSYILVPGRAPWWCCGPTFAILVEPTDGHILGPQLVAQFAHICRTSRHGRDRPFGFHRASAKGFAPIVVSVQLAWHAAFGKLIRLLRTCYIDWDVKTQTQASQVESCFWPQHWKQYLVYFDQQCNAPCFHSGL